MGRMWASPPSCRRCLRAVTGWRSAWRGTGLPGAGSLWSRESSPPSSSTWSAGKGGGGGGAGRAPTCARKPAGTPPPAPAVLEGLTQPWGQRQGRRPPPRVSTRFFSFLDPIPPRTFATTCGDVPPHFQPTSRPLPPPFPTIEGDGSVSHRAHRRWKHRSEEHTSELQSRENLVCRLLLEKK